MTATIPTTDHSNADQLRAWDGEDGAFWTAHADAFDRSVAGHYARFLDAAAIGVADRVLDIGCGTGQTTRDAARAAPGGFALGVDLSSAMLDLARRRADAEGLANARFEHGDAQVFPFAPGEFDLAISRTGAMFFDDPLAAFTNIARAIRPGGRLVLLTWQPVSRNPWFREFFTALAAGRNLPAPPPDAPTPFSLSDPDRVEHLLAGAGFAGIDLVGSQAGMWFGASVGDAVDLMLGVLGWMLNGLDDHARHNAIADLRATMQEHETPDGVIYDSAAWIIRASRA